MNIVERVVAWNQARYEQVYNHELACDLLFEEYNEWLEASIPVDKLDALCDMYFVAIGVLWKLNVNTAPELLAPKGDLHPDTIARLTFHLNRFMEAEERPILVSNCTSIVNYAVQGMFDMGLSPEQAIEAITIVCDSNDSKAIKKTDPAVKANIDKGTGFIKPEPRLQLLLDSLGESNAT